jgi:hypothetical protein
MLLGSLGTVLSTTAIVPHLVHALRHRHPSGSTTGWMVGALSSIIWFAYGIDRHDLLQAAPGFVTVPVGVFLTGWCLLTAHRSHRRLAAAGAPVHAVPDVAVPAGPDTPHEAGDPVAEMLRSMPAELHNLRDLGDTLELPRISA